MATLVEHSEWWMFINVPTGNTSPGSGKGAVQVHAVALLAAWLTVLLWDVIYG